jgi:hypothetical protein
MKVILNKSIIGYKNDDQFITRIHADKGSELSVILNNNTYFICDSVNYPGNHIVVFPSQCEEVIHEEVIQTDDHDIEKFYNTYEKPSKSPSDDPFYRALFTETDE